jgi:uncharacterized membrane protein
MRKLLPTLSRLYHQYAVLAAMIFSSALCICILALRVAHTRSFTFSFLAWNLFLAWLPLISAFIIYKFDQKLLGRFRVLPLISMSIWLVFLPNAPYLITDLVHLTPRNDISFWFDLTMFITFAVTGLLYGLVSLYWMQQIIFNMAGSMASWLFVIGVSALSSFGIYLGRFEHWNSWDIVSNPMGLFTNIWEIVRHPIANFEIFAFSGLFTLFLIAAYFMLNALTRLPQENRKV